MSRFQESGKSNASLIGSFAAILLAFFFAGSAVLVLLFGVREYESTVKQSSNDFSSRTLLTYITEKIRHCDAAGEVSVREIDGTPALVLVNSDGETKYETFLYEYEGSVRELTVTNEADWQLDAGEPILEAAAFKPEELRPGLFYFSCAYSNGENAATYVDVRSSGNGEEKTAAAQTSSGTQESGTAAEQTSSGTQESETAAAHTSSESAGEESSE